MMGRGQGGGGGGGRKARGAGGAGAGAAAQQQQQPVQGLPPGMDLNKAIDLARRGPGWGANDADVAAADAFLATNPQLAAQYGEFNQSAVKSPQELGLQVVNNSVMPNPAGAPALPTRLLTEADAMARLRAVGMPMEVISKIDNYGSLQEVASVLPVGAKVIGRPGIEGIGVDVGGGKVWRVQYNSDKIPIATTDIGKLGVYPEWTKQYGSVWIEQKAKVPILARDLSPIEQARGAAKLRYEITRNYKHVNMKGADLHAGNWGMYRNSNGSVSVAILDAGAAPKYGAPVTNQGF